jgi:hypothetical protein
LYLLYLSQLRLPHKDRRGWKRKRDRSIPASGIKVADLKCTTSLGSGTFSATNPSSIATGEGGKGHAILTINLQEALITSYQIAGSQASDSPHESIQIDFGKVCVSEPGNGSKLCFDRTQNKTF